MDASEVSPTMQEILLATLDTGIQHATTETPDGLHFVFLLGFVMVH